jgi:prevent-host-death family protein
MPNRRGAEDARTHLPELLEDAERGRSTIITKRGKPVAVLAPISAFDAIRRQASILDHEGTGSGLWGEVSSDTIRNLRDEWER